MSDINVEKILKLLRMTTSDNDNEAVIAIRQVNKMLNNAGLTWDKVVVIKTTTQSDSDDFWDNIAKKAKAKEQDMSGIWKDIPEYFSSVHFKAVCECEEFTKTLSSNKIKIFNVYIEKYNKYKVLDRADWAYVRFMWTEFRSNYKE